MRFTYIEAMRLAFDHSLAQDKQIMLFGLGVGDVGGVFGTTLGLQEKYGSDRVFDIPLSENAITGMALGLSIQGFRPIMVHQRSDFTFTSAEQIINQIAKTEYMSNKRYKVPIVIRMIVGRGWGQGPTHAQAPHAIFSHVPGLTVVAPASPSDGYHLLRAALKIDCPVIFIEHRWLHETNEEFEPSDVLPSIASSKIVRSGSAATVVSLSYGVLECLKIADVFNHFGISIEVINLRSIKPWDHQTIIASTARTKKLAIWDIGHKEFGVSAEISHVIQNALFGELLAPVERFGLPSEPTPSSPFLAMKHYEDLDQAILRLNSSFEFGLNPELLISTRKKLHPHRTIFQDQPDVGEVGPF
jgi:pyruvate/2-oxoglutarate/acetoin dehydrogenase E1 component